MSQPAFDAEALITMFETATAQQSQQLRQAVSQATLTALQGRELSLRNIRSALKAVTEAAGAGVARNPLGADVAPLLDQAVAGMDDALLKAVEANRVALAQLVAQGADLREKHLQKALDDLDKIEDTLIGVVKKAAGGAGASVAGPWEQVLERMQAGGTLSGAKAATTVEQMMTQMHEAARASRRASLRAAQALAESYSALVSGVLIGMSDALRQGGGKSSGDTAKPAARRR
jgi:hypothetical protein